MNVFAVYYVEGEKDDGSPGICLTLYEENWITRKRLYERKVNFSNQGDLIAWLDHAASLPGTTTIVSGMDEEDSSFLNDGTLTEQEWWQRALGVEAC